MFNKFKNTKSYSPSDIVGKKFYSAYFKSECKVVDYTHDEKWHFLSMYANGICKAQANINEFEFYD